MGSGILYCHDSETYEKFIQRASRVFSAEDVRSWPRVERAVFNHLLAPLIHKFNRGSISD